MKTKEVTLPSGAKVTIKQPGMRAFAEAVNGLPTFLMTNQGKTLAAQLEEKLEAFAKTKDPEIGKQIAASTQPMLDAFRTTKVANVQLDTRLCCACLMKPRLCADPESANGTFKWIEEELDWQDQQALSLAVAEFCEVSVMMETLLPLFFGSKKEEDYGA